VLLAPLDRVRESVRVLGIAQTSDCLALDEKDDITTFASLRAAAAQAYRMAGLGPREIEFAEVHDCFTIAEILAIEDLGFVAKGQGGPYTASGATARDGERPVNASGGLKSKGHPVGATGVAQICDLARQIRGEAGDLQLRRHSIGLAQNLGGSGATSVVAILGAA
jgi:acetyl-CoA C-acetyltransferase